MTDTTVVRRELQPADFALLAVLAVLVAVAGFAFARSVQGGTLLADPAGDIPDLSELTPYPTVEDGVQKIFVDTSLAFNPQTIFAQAGTPLEIEFGPAEKGGCYESIGSQALGIPQTDLTDGAVIQIADIEAGQYQMECWMDMAFITIVAE